MEVLSVPIAPEYAAFIDEQMTAGHYQSASEIVQEGLRLLQQQNETEPVRLEAIRQEVKAGFAQLDRGDYIEFNSSEEAIAHFHAKARELAAQGKTAQ